PLCPPCLPQALCQRSRSMTETNHRAQTEARSSMLCPLLQSPHKRLRRLRIQLPEDLGGRTCRLPLPPASTPKKRRHCTRHKPGSFCLWPPQAVVHAVSGTRLPNFPNQIFPRSEAAACNPESYPQARTLFLMTRREQHLSFLAPRGSAARPAPPVWPNTERCSARPRWPTQPKRASPGARGRRPRSPLLARTQKPFRAIVVRSIPQASLLAALRGCLCQNVPRTWRRAPPATPRPLL